MTSPPCSQGVVLGCLFCHVLFRCPIKAVNTSRPVESTLGDKCESQGCGARAQTDSGSEAPYTRPLPTLRPGVGSRDCPVAERDKRIPMSRNCLPLTVLHPGRAASRFGDSPRRGNFLFVKE